MPSGRKLPKKPFEDDDGKWVGINRNKKKYGKEFDRVMEIMTDIKAVIN